MHDTFPMSTKNDDADSKRHENEAEGGVSGAIAGAVIGSIAGPPGAIAGAVLGGIAGTITGAIVSEENLAEDERATVVDDQIGVTAGTIGTTAVKHPPAKVGAYSSAASGAGGSSDAAPAEGPTPPPET